MAALPLALGAVLAGPVVDRTSSRTLTVAAAAWQATVCLAMAAAHLAGVPDATLLVGLFLLQLGQAVAGPTWSALLPHLVRREELPAAVGSVQALTMLLGMLGPVAAGSAVGVGGLEVALLAAAAVFGAVALLAAQVRCRRHVTRAADDPAPGGLDGLRFLRADQVLSPLIGGLVAFVLVVEVVGVVLVLLVRGDLGAGELTYGVLGSVLAVGLVLGNLVAAKLATGQRMVRAAVVGALGMAAALVAGGLAPSVLLLGAALLLLGLSNGVVNTAASTVLAVRVPVERRGRVLAAVSGLLRTASVLGLCGGGLVGTVSGARPVLVLSGALGLLVGAWLWSRLWRGTLVAPAEATPGSGGAARVVGAPVSAPAAR